jgi:excisionase family DNA binding protein
MRVDTPLAVRPSQAAQMLGIGMTKLYELLDEGGLESFHIGRSRRITTASIARYIERQLTVANSKPSPPSKAA